MNNKEYRNHENGEIILCNLYDIIDYAEESIENIKCMTNIEESKNMLIKGKNKLDVVIKMLSEICE